MITDRRILDVARAEERAAVVDWLRQQALLCGRAANAAVDNHVKLSEVNRARHYVQTASCIERGAHLEQKS